MTEEWRRLPRPTWQKRSVASGAKIGREFPLTAGIVSAVLAPVVAAIGETAWEGVPHG